MSNIYQIQQIKMDEFAADEFTSEPVMSVFAETKDGGEALRLWNSYCSGACDSEVPFDGQNHGIAYFYRIVVRDANDED